MTTTDIVLNYDDAAAILDVARCLADLTDAETAAIGRLERKLAAASNQPDPFPKDRPPVSAEFLKRNRGH